jgi:hypothetical protein
LLPERISHSERSEHIIDVIGDDYDGRGGNCGFDGIRGAVVYGGGEDIFVLRCREFLTEIQVDIDPESISKLSQLSHKNRVINLTVLLTVYHSISV